MEQWRIDQLNESLNANRQQMARMRPIRFSIKKIRAMSDEEIMAIMSGEADIEGTLYPDTLHLLSTELTRREVQRSSKPHWTTVPGFALAAVAAVASVIAVAVSVFALLKEPEPAPPTQKLGADHAALPIGLSLKPVQ